MFCQPFSKVSSLLNAGCPRCQCACEVRLLGQFIHLVILSWRAPLAAVVSRLPTLVPCGFFSLCYNFQALGVGRMKQSLLTEVSANFADLSWKSSEICAHNVLDGCCFRQSVRMIVLAKCKSVCHELLLSLCCKLQSLHWKEPSLLRSRSRQCNAHLRPPRPGVFMIGGKGRLLSPKISGNWITYRSLPRLEQDSSWPHQMLNNSFVLAS